MIAFQLIHKRATLNNSESLNKSCHLKYSVNNILIIVAYCFRGYTQCENAVGLICTLGFALRTKFPSALLHSMNSLGPRHYCYEV